MRFVDTHCHLDFEPLASALPEVMQRAAAAGVDRIIAPAYDAESRLEVVSLAARSGVFPALGLHPWAAAEDLDLGVLRSQLIGCDAVAIGEIGLDTKIEQPSFDRQLEVFELQIALAAELDLPVILHCRGAFEELLRVIGNTKSPIRGVVHAYSRGPQLANRLVEAGLVLGIGGAATRPRADRLRRTLQAVPLDHIVLETDAPSIGLDGVPAEETEPCHVAQIAAAVAEVTDSDIAEVARKTSANAERLFAGLRAG